MNLEEENNSNISMQAYKKKKFRFILRSGTAILISEDYNKFRYSLVKKTL